MSHKRALAVLVCLLAVGAVGVGIGAHLARRSDAAGLVARAHQAMQAVPRLGRVRTQTWYGSQPVSSLADVEYGRAGYYRLEYRNPPLEGVLCVAGPHVVWRLDPRRRVLEEMEAGNDRVDLPLMLANYGARRVGEGRVAGRPVDQVALVRRHGRGVARRLWLDRETGLPLRVEEYGPRGALQCATEYLSIRFQAPSPARFARPRAAGVRVVRSAPAAPQVGAAPQHPMRPLRAPPGYRLVDSQRLRCFCGCGSILSHTRFTDGLESLSLFECGHESMDMAACARVSSGQDSIASRIYQGHTFVAVGRVRPKELERMLQSLP